MAGFNHFAALASDLHKQSSQIVRKTAFVVEGGAKVEAPVDKGAMKNSVHTITSDSSNYAEAMSAAHSANPEAKLFDELPKPTSDQQAIVAVGVEYGEYVNDGTVYQAPNPFFTRAAEAARPGYIEAFRQLHLKA